MEKEDKSDNHDKLKKQARDFFDKNKQIKCPAFPKEKINFNSKGINHLFYKGARSERNIKEIETRVFLLPRVKTLLEKMPIPQEEDWYEMGSTKISFWAFEGVVEGRRIKVVVRQIGDGKKHFWSVIPFWRKTRFGVKNSKKSLNKED
jgi:hypothetical protein